jgi:hypothetical protein
VIRTVLRILKAKITSDRDELDRAVARYAGSYGAELVRESNFSVASSFIIKWVPEQISETDFNFARLQVSYVNMSVFERLVDAVDGDSFVGCKNFLVRAFGAYRLKNPSRALCV